MLTTCSDTRFAVLQDVGIILSGIERNNHIICGFLSLNYPWDNNETLKLSSFSTITDSSILCANYQFISNRTDVIFPFLQHIRNKLVRYTPLAFSSLFYKAKDNNNKA